MFIRESVVFHRLAVAALLALLLLATASLALQSGQTAGGAAYAAYVFSGGVSQEELRALHEQRNDDTLWVITAASKSDSHLARVLATIRDNKQQTVFSGGPWLFINLPLGAYQNPYAGQKN